MIERSTGIPSSIIEQVFPSDVVDHTSENGQIVWLKSAPKEVKIQTTFDQESQRQEEQDRS